MDKIEQDINLVSVILPVYNREEVIKRAIESVLAQSYSYFELIIVDDGSFDKTVHEIEKFQDKRIHLFINETNKGANYSRNRGIELSKGAFITFIDSSDVWADNKIQTQLDYIRKCDVDFISCKERAHDLSGHERILPIMPEFGGVLSKEYALHILSTRNFIDTTTIMARKNAFQKAGVFDESFPRLQDYEWVIRAMTECSYAFQDAVLVDSYIMKDSISRNEQKYAKAILLLCRKHYSFFMEHNSLEAVLSSPIQVINHPTVIKDFVREIYLDSLLNNHLLYITNLLSDVVAYSSLHMDISEPYLPPLAERINDGSSIVLFGAGAWAQKVVIYLLSKNENMHFKAYVTQYKGQSLPNTQICTLDHLDAEDIDNPIIIASSWRKEREIYEILKELGFTQIVCLSPTERRLIS